MTGALIAGGRSSRMGRDKRALTLADVGAVGDPALNRDPRMTLAARQVALLRAVFADVLVVADDPSPFAGLGARIVPDACGLEGLGPLAGLASALTHARTDRVLACAVDLPHLSPEVVRAVALHDGTLAGGAAPLYDIVIPESDGGPEPLCAVYAARALPVVLERLRAGRRSLTGLLEDPRLRALRIPRAALAGRDPDGLSFRNVNTPLDLARSCASTARPHPPHPSEGSHASWRS